jgi:hypothetical protein
VGAGYRGGTRSGLGKVDKAHTQYERVKIHCCAVERADGATGAAVQRRRASRRLPPRAEEEGLPPDPRPEQAALVHAPVLRERMAAAPPLSDGGGLIAGWLDQLSAELEARPELDRPPIGTPHERDAAAGFASMSALSLFARIPPERKQSLVSWVREECPRSPLAKAMGSMVALAAADATGHWFEFMPVCDFVGENDGGSRFVVSELELVPGRQDRERPMPNSADRAGIPACFEGRVFNKFALQMGQWTDDCSMALALADSLIVRRSYDGSDVRARFWSWWNKVRAAFLLAALTPPGGGTL